MASELWPSSEQSCDQAGHGPNSNNLKRTRDLETFGWVNAPNHSVYNGVSYTQLVMSLSI